MASPIRVHRPKCVFAGERFGLIPPKHSRALSSGHCTCFEFPDGYVPPILPNTDFNRGILVVKVEWRKNHSEGDLRRGDWYVFAWTTAPDKAWWGPTRKPENYWFIANNATSVLRYVRETPRLFPPNGPYVPPTESSTLQENTVINAETLRRQAAALLAEAERIDSLPSEPPGIPLNPKKKRSPSANVVWWRMRFNKRGSTRYTANPRIYTYAAVRTSEGLWSTTGPQSPKDYTWDELINWIYNNMEDPVIYEVVTLDRLN